MSLNDLLGSCGVALILLAYALQTMGSLSSRHIAYILMNLFGAGMACAASVLIRYYPFVVLEAAWTLVSLGALLSRWRQLWRTPQHYPVK